MTKQKAGFSIVELIVVIVVIAILITIAVVSYSWMRNDAIDAKMEATVADVKKALQLKYAKTGSMLPRQPHSSRESLLKEMFLGQLSDQINVQYQHVVRDAHDAKRKPMVVLTPRVGDAIFIVSHNLSRKQFAIDAIGLDGTVAERKYIDYDGWGTVTLGKCSIGMEIAESGWSDSQFMSVSCAL